MNRLRMQIEYHQVFVHSIPATCVDFSPEFFRYTNDEWKRRIQIINQRWAQVCQHRTRPAQRKKEHKHGLKNDGIHPDIVVYDHNFALMNYTYENFNKKLWLDFEKKIIEVKILKFEAFHAQVVLYLKNWHYLGRNEVIMQLE